MRGTWQTAGGGGGGLAVVLVVLAVIAAGAWHVRHGIETGLEIAYWTIVGVCGLAASAGLVCGVIAFLRWRADRGEQQAQTVIPGRAEPESPAIEAPKMAQWPLPGQWEEVKAHARDN